MYIQSVKVVNVRISMMIFAVLCVFSCSPSALQVQARVANAMALEANNVLPTLVHIYTAEGLSVIHESQTLEAANQGLASVRLRWRRVWGIEADGSPCHGAGTASGTPCANGAWQGLSASENVWAVTLEKQIAGQPFDLAAAVQMASDLHASYCALRGAVPDDVHLPDPPAFLSCAPASAAPASSSLQPSH